MTNREKPSHKRIDYKSGKTESVVMERNLSNAQYRIVHYKKEGPAVVQYRQSTKEATELFNKLLTELR